MRELRVVHQFERDRHQSRTSRQYKYARMTGKATAAAQIPVTPRNASGTLIVKPTAAQRARASAVLAAGGQECTRVSRGEFCSLRITKSTVAMPKAIASAIKSS